MKWKNAEMSVYLREDNIIVIRMNKDVNKLTVPGSEEVVVKIKEAMELNGQPSVLLFYMPNIYISKGVLRCYADTVFGEAGMAIFCESLTAWLVGNIGITIRQRFMQNNPTAGAPIKAFKEEEEALKWSYDRLKEAF